MGTYNESEAHRCQFLYDFYKCEECWQKLFMECLSISEMVVKSILKRQQSGLDPDRLYDVMIDATSRLLERKRREKPYVIKTFRSCLWNEVTFALYNKKQFQNENDVELDLALDTPQPPTVDTEDTRFAFKDLWTLPNGTKIVYTIFMADSFRKAILALDKIMRRRQIYDYVGRIKLVYEWSRLAPPKDTSNGINTRSRTRKEIDWRRIESLAHVR